MSSGLPTASAAIASSGAPATMEPPSASAGQSAPAREPAPILSNQELSTGLRDLTESVSDIKHALAVLLKRTAPPPPPPPPASVPQKQGVPITELKFPSSPSPLPSWATAPTFEPGQPSAPPMAASSGAAARGGLPGYAEAYSSLTPPSIPAAPGRHEGAFAAASHGQQPPRFAKLEFFTYDGTVDPLNWLNQCEQFFRGQRTLASDRTWLASYHLRDAAQTWYYALEQDEGEMPSWERFRDLCLRRFGPPVRGSRLAELGRLTFTGTVQDFADRFQALACHAPDVSGRQRADLFIGGLPDHIRVDVELREPQDLQSAMYYARAYEQRANAMQQLLPNRGVRVSPRPATPTPAPPRVAAPTTPGAAPAPTRPFKRLTAAEQLERRRKGL